MESVLNICTKGCFFIVAEFTSIIPSLIVEHFSSTMSIVVEDIQSSHQGFGTHSVQYIYIIMQWQHHKIQLTEQISSPKRSD